MLVTKGTFVGDSTGHEKDVDPLLVLLEEIFKRLMFWNLLSNGPKYYFGGYEAEFLGHLVNGDGHTYLNCRVEAISEMAHPHSKKQVKMPMGGINLFGEYEGIKFSFLTVPMTKLLQNDVTFEWSEECGQNFNKTRRLISENVKLFFLFSGL